MAEAVADETCRTWLERWWSEASRHLQLPEADVAAYRTALLDRFANPRIHHRLDQIAALPLGGRVKVDPWSDQVELSKAKPVALTSAREKLEFEITPFFPYLTRLSTGNNEKMAQTAPAAAENQPK